MAITKGSFTGKRMPEPQDALHVLRHMEGAEAQQSSLTKGTTGPYGRQSSLDEPGGKPDHGPGSDPVPPRSLYSAEVGMGVVGDARHPLVTAPEGTRPTGDLHANPASTGKQSLGKLLIGGGVHGNEHAPLKTGAGQGNEVVKTYAPRSPKRGRR